MSWNSGIVSPRKGEEVLSINVQTFSSMLPPILVMMITFGPVAPVSMFYEFVLSAGVILLHQDRTECLTI